MNPYDYRSADEKYLDLLLTQHADGEHQVYRVRDCVDCIEKVDDE